MSTSDLPPPLPQSAAPNRKSRRRIYVIITVVLMVFGLALWFYPSANNHLAARDIPRLPFSAKVEHLREGGFFAGWLFIRASLTPEDFNAYASKFSQPREVIGRGRGQLLIVSPADEKSLYANYPEAEIQFTQSVAGTESWWTPHEITKGFVYRWSDGVDGWRVYFDAQRSLVFIYWHHS
jgi:hypothetical protein